MERSLRARTRIVMELRKRGIPSVPIFGRYNYRRAMPGLESHRHPGAIEICYLVRGRQTYEVRGERYSLRGGDVFLTFPGETHGTGGEPEEKGLLYWVTLLAPAHTGDSFLGLPPRSSDTLWKSLRKLSRRHFPGRSEMKLHLDALTELALRRSSPLFRIAATHHLTGLLLAVLSAHEEAICPHGNARIKAVLAWIESHLESPDELTVECLARVAGLSPSRFQILFKQETGIPSAEFALRARIAEASRRLARSEANVTTIAYSLGFSSSQYFAAAFRRFTSMSPTEFLRKHDTKTTGGPA